MDLTTFINDLKSALSPHDDMSAEELRDQCETAANIVEAFSQQWQTRLANSVQGVLNTDENLDCDAKDALFERLTDALI